MPIYEYRCASCGFEKEYLQKLSDAPIAVCESCGKSSMTKLVSAAGFQLKGSGWYVTDFKNSGGGKDKPASKSSEEGKANATTGEAADKAPAEAKTGGESKSTSEAKPSSDSGSSSEAKGSKEAKPAAGASSGSPPAA